MNKIIILFIIAFLLVIGIQGDELRPVCTLHTLHGSPSIQRATENPGGVTYTQIQLPWLVIPHLYLQINGVNISLVELASQQPWVAGVLASHEQLFEVQLPKLEIGAMATQGANKCTGSDTMSFHWYNSTFTKSFSEYPTPCNNPYPQQFGVDSHSSSLWGDKPRSVMNGKVLAPQGGDESMEAIVQRTPSTAPSIPLAIRFSSNSYYPVVSVTYRSCVMLDEASLLAEMYQHLTSSTDPSPPSSSLIATPATVSDSISLWPVRSCVQQESDGTCLVHFGYIYTGGTGAAIDIPVDAVNNFLSPNDVAKRVPDVTTHFLPGVHYGQFRVRWFCVGKLIGTWNALSWTLHGSRVMIEESVERCGDSADPSMKNKEEEERAMAYVRQAQSHYDKKTIE